MWSWIFLSQDWWDSLQNQGINEWKQYRYLFGQDSLKNKEWYVDGKAPLNLGYDAIRLRVDLVIPRVSAFGDIALTQVWHNIWPTIQKMDRWSFFICIGSEESGTLPIEPQTPSVIISLLIKIWRLGRYEIWGILGKVEKCSGKEIRLPDRDKRD